MNYYDKDGKPMELMEWSKAFEDLKYRVVANDVVNGYQISTIWMGLDHSFFGNPPVIFETMAFKKSHIKYQERYSTLEEAIKGHQHVIKLAESQAEGSDLDLRSEDPALSE